MPLCRLFETLRYHYEQNYKLNMLQFVTAINDASRQAQSKAEITYHALRLILTEPYTKASFTYEQLEAIHHYLVPFGEGLDEQPIFARTSVVDMMARSENILYLVPSKPCMNAATDHASGWDLRSTFELEQTLHRFGPRFQFKSTTELIVPPALLDDDEQKRITAYFGQPKCIVSTGSTMVSSTSELMLSAMFGVPPFTPPSSSGDTSKQLPFYFSWPPRKSKGLRSSFALNYADLPESEASLAADIKAGTASAMLIDNRFYRVPHDQTEWLMYGIIAAQRRGPGQLWVVLAGISGPATYAAARLLKEIKHPLPSTPGKNAPVLWAPIEATIVTVPERKVGDNRKMAECRFLAEPTLWQPQ